MARQIGQTASPLVRAALTGALAAVLAIGAQAMAGAADANKACGLLTAAELEAALGGKVSGLKGGVASPMGPGPTGKVDAEFCSADTPTATVLLRLAKKTGRAPDAGAKGLAMAKQMGAQVEVKTFGSITCSSIVPPKGLEQHGFNTTCSVDKGAELAAVEVTTKSQKGMIAIDKLRRLAEKMASRF